MYRLHLFLPKVSLGAILLFLVCAPALFAQVNYTVTATLNLESGPDPLGFDELTVGATATLSQTMPPSNSTTTATSSTNTYTAVSGVALVGATCDTSSPVTVTLTDNLGAPDTIAVSNCLIQSAVVSASATIPAGYMSTAVPSNIPLTNNVTGTVTYTLDGIPTVFSLTDASIIAIGTPVATLTPSPASWTPPAVAAGSTTPISQQFTFTTSPVLPGGVVSFATSAATTPSGGTWLSVTQAASNSSSSITVTANPAGLSGGSYSGTVTLSYGGDVTATIPVTLTIAGPTTALTGPAAMTFNYALGSTPPPTQTLSIGSSPASSASVNAAVTTGNTWLSVSPATGTLPANFTVSVNTVGLTGGTLNGNIQITGSGLSNSPLNIPVTYNVSSSTLTVPSTPLTFNYTVGGSTPALQSVSITGTSGISFTSSAGGTPWLLATPSGIIPSPISVSINTAGLSGLPAGSYNGTVTVTSAGASGSPASIPVTLNVIAPALTASPSQLNFNYQIGSTTQPVAQTIGVGDASNVNFTATAATIPAGGAWLSVTPGTGAASGSVSVSVNTTGLAANTYNGTITIAATGATPQVVNVSLVVTMPSVTVNASSLSFAYQTGTTAPAAQTIAIGGTSNLAFTATAAGGSWLSVTPGSGTVSSSSSVSVSVNTSGLAAKTYNGTVTIAAPGATSQVVNVSLVVSSTPTISASPSVLSFVYQTGGTTPATQSVNIGGSSGLAFTATAAGGSWLAVTPGSGATPASLNVSVNPSGLAANTYNGTITIAASGAATQTVNVSLLVSNQPALTATPASLSFSYALGGAAPAAQELNIAGASGLAYTATGGASWLTATPGSGTLPGLLSVSVNPSAMTAGTYKSSITINAAGTSNSPFSIPVTLTVTGVAPSINLSASTLNFGALAGGSPPASQTVNVTGAAASSVSLGIQGGAWLSASLSGSTPAVVTVSVNQSNLAPGNYSGTVLVTAVGASNSPQTIAVQLVVSSTATLTATPANLGFAFLIGNPNPPAQTVSLTATQAGSFTTSIANGSWLTVTSSSATTPAALTVSVNPGTLASGTYTATISITSAATSAPLLVPVTLVISSQPTLAVSPSSLTFTTSAGANPPSQSVNLTGSSVLPFSIATSPSWLGVSVASGTTPSTLVVTVNTTGMSQGSYQGTITIASAVASNGPLVIPVSLNLTAPLVATGPTISAIVNAASYDASGFSPGAIMSIFGNLLGPQSGVSFTVNSNGTLATTLSGATVTVGGVPAIPLFVQNGQINVILPFTLGTSGQANVEVQYNNLATTGFSIPLTPADVQIFTANASGSGPGSILNQDYSVNSASNPAAPGSVVQIFGTGAGALGGGTLGPAAIAGNVAGDTLSWVDSPYSATVNGENAAVLYAGSAPGLVYGVDQFDVQLPADATAGAATIILTVGESASQANVTVFVK
jgi:uncharacterized protein (TIGR03437 family)